jgi:hypothetical protein
MYAIDNQFGGPGPHPGGRYPQSSVTHRDNRPTLRIIVVIAVVGCGAWLLGTGLALETVVLFVLGLALAGVTVARWVVDGAPLPHPTALLPHAGRTGGAA